MTTMRAAAPLAQANAIAKRLLRVTVFCTM